jgi:hypothetical protein
MMIEVSWLEAKAKYSIVVTDLGMMIEVSWLE